MSSSFNFPIDDGKDCIEYEEVPKGDLHMTPFSWEHLPVNHPLPSKSLFHLSHLPIDIFRNENSKTRPEIRPLVT
jgi:hypothetical protein